MNRSLPALALVLLVAAPARAELDVQVHGDTLDLHARQVPLHEVLDRLASQTGMKVVYDTEPPMEIVTIDRTSVSLRQAVAELLHGHGLTYVVRMKGAGGVDTVLLTHGGARGGGARMAPPPQPAMEGGAQQEEYYEEAEPPEPPESTQPPPTQAPGFPSPGAVWTGPITLPGGGMPGFPTPGAPPSSEQAPIQDIPPSTEAPG